MENSSAFNFLSIKNLKQRNADKNLHKMYVKKALEIKMFEALEKNEQNMEKNFQPQFC